MGTTDDTLQALNRLEKTIKEQRALLLQAHGVQATYVARDLIGRSAEQVDSVRISPLLDALGSSNRVDELRVLYVT